VVIVFALGASLVNTITSFLQRLGIEDAPRKSSMGTGIISHALRSPIWILGFVCMGGGFVFQALALHAGSLAVVQPLLTTELFFVVVVLWFWYSVPVRARDWAFSALTIAGLATFLVVLAPTSSGHTPTRSAWISSIVAILAVMGALLVASRTGPPWWRALSIGAAASVGFALTAALTKSFTDAFGHGIGTVLTTWETYGLAVVGLGSFYLMQNAFHAGPFAASQSTLILVNPFVSVALGSWLFDEKLPHSAAAVTIGVAAAIVFLAGAIGLCTSPLIAGVHGTDDDVQMLAGRGRLARWQASRARP
jgi:drug/metabolite transporter (DMT)-like permease